MAVVAVASVAAEVEEEEAEEAEEASEVATGAAVVVAAVVTPLTRSKVELITGLRKGYRSARQGDGSPSHKQLVAGEDRSGGRIKNVVYVFTFDISLLLPSRRVSRGLSLKNTWRSLHRN